jgi:4-hydroxy-tetrahydrodipicolinate reductase
MNIALIGYGKMGKEIEAIAIGRGHQITCRVDSKLPIDKADFSTAEVAIEFSKPDLVLQHIDYCLANELPVVVGTTGWNKDLDSVSKKVKDSQGSLLHASNFSVGVNIFFEINRLLARLINPHKEYQLSVTEIHHTQKLDSPSGTAISIANDIISESEYEKWQCIDDNNGVSSSKAPTFDIIAKRISEVPGTHIVEYDSDVDRIEIKHEAKNRKGFALGAVLAAEWLSDKKGIYTMKDVLNIS